MAASGTTLGVLGTSKMKGNERFYGFTDFRGKLARRGRGSRGSENQVTAGSPRLQKNMNADHARVRQVDGESGADTERHVEAEHVRDLECTMKKWSDSRLEMKQSS